MKIIPTWPNLSVPRFHQMALQGQSNFKEVFDGN